MSAGNAALTVSGGSTRVRVRERTTEVSELVEREAGKLLNYFVRRTARADDAADLLGETLLIVWRRESSIPEDDTRSKMWMYGIARKVLAGQHRTARRRTALSQRLAEELLTALPAPTDDVAAAEVRSAIELLDEVDQEIIRLYYWDGFTLAEAATLLGIRQVTVRSRHARARAKLRTHLAAGGEVRPE